MGKKIYAIISVIAMIAVSTPVFAQGGWNFKSGKDCWTIVARGGATMTPDKKLLPYGEAEVIRDMRNGSLQTYVMVYGFYDNRLVPGINVGASVRLGNQTAGIRLFGGAGFGAANHTVVGENASYEATITRMKLKPEITAGLNGYVNFGSFGLTANVRYAHQFNIAYGQTYLEDMTITGESWSTARLVATLGLQYNFCRQSNYDGDKCMQIKLGGNFSKRNIYTVGADWYRRLSYHWMFFYGTEFGMASDKRISAVGEVGFQYLIFDGTHADSWILPTIAFQAGLGEQKYNSFASTADTADVPYASMTTSATQGLELGGYFGIHFQPLKALHVKNTKGEPEVGIGYKYRTTITSDHSFSGEATGSSQKVDVSQGYIVVTLAYTF